MRPSGNHPRSTSLRGRSVFTVLTSQSGEVTTVFELIEHILRLLTYLLLVFALGLKQNVAGLCVSNRIFCHSQLLCRDDIRRLQ